VAILLTHVKSTHNTKKKHY